MKIVLTRRAENNYRSIKRYFLEEWGGMVSEAFEQKVTDFLDLLEAFPEIGSVEFLDKEIRGFQITKHTRVFYRIKKGTVIILSFFDVRQNPLKKSID
jgi:plasmid stabilization system protein ParE